MKPLTIDGFWAKIDRSGGPDACWPWLGNISSQGYGRFVERGKQVFAHRRAYELILGPFPDGKVPDHLCRNRACCNPAHLEPVTSGENVLRGESFAAVNARKTYCPHGHPYDDANTQPSARGQRYCRECRREHWKRYSERIGGWAARRQRSAGAASC